MIIRTHVDLTKLTSTPKVEVSKKDEDVIVKPVINEISRKKKNKKTTPIVVEESVMVEEKVEDDIDLSKWLEEDIEE